MDNYICKIADTMTSKGRKISSPTVETYIEALNASYLIYKCSRYDVKGKQYLDRQEKYYIADIGLRYMLLGSQGGDVGHILENVIYLELIRRGFDVYIGKMGDYEIDFVAMKGGEIIYYQVALTVNEESTLQREIRPLMKIRDHFSKILITMDNNHEIFHNGIRRIYAIDFLMEE